MHSRVAAFTCSRGGFFQSWPVLASHSRRFSTQSLVLRPRRDQNLLLANTIARGLNPEDGRVVFQHGGLSFRSVSFDGSSTRGRSLSVSLTRDPHRSPMGGNSQPKSRFLRFPLMSSRFRCRSGAQQFTAQKRGDFFTINNLTPTL